ncbi:MAG: hypothetical protein H7320_10155 [Ferruginibacter sp.]|nr:hypothetical protein [Ferruginibacter sp.]
MMTDKTKITLSAKELELVCNTDWILTKLNIMQKVIDLFGNVLASMQQLTAEQKNNLPAEVFIKDPKIYKGENYKNLPYVMLDYPRYFDKENTLAIRTFFWWGNFFSINLQLSGEIKDGALLQLTAHFLQLQQNDYWICINNNPWQHNFEEDNYLPIKKISLTQFTTMLNRESFVKIGKNFSLLHWDISALLIKQSFKEMLLLLKI